MYVVWKGPQGIHVIVCLYIVCMLYGKALKEYMSSCGIDVLKFCLNIIFQCKWCNYGSFLQPHVCVNGWSKYWCRVAYKKETKTCVFRENCAEMNPASW